MPTGNTNNKRGSEKPAKFSPSDPLSLLPESFVTIRPAMPINDSLAQISDMRNLT